MDDDDPLTPHLSQEITPPANRQPHSTNVGQQETGLGISSRTPAHEGILPQETVAFAHAVEFNRSSDGGGISPGTSPGESIGGAITQQYPSGGQPAAQDPRYISPGHGPHGFTYASEISPTATGPMMQMQQSSLSGQIGETSGVGRHFSTSTARTIRGPGEDMVSGVEGARLQRAGSQRRFVGGFEASDQRSSALSVASAPTVIVGGSSTRNNSVATGQTNFTTSSAPVHSFGGNAGSRRRSSLTHSLWLHSLPLPAFGVQPQSTTSGFGARSETQQHQGDRTNTQRYLDDPLAPLNLSSSTNPELQYEDVLLSSQIFTSEGGQAYMAQVSGPSSAPATPGILQEPSRYIHTHLPRRASLTPANLHLVGPVPPSASVIEQVRRESLALLYPAPSSPSLGGQLGSGMFPSTTATVPPGNFEHFGQMQWGSRRKSLTPTTPSLAMASPTRLTATASISRKSALGADLANSSGGEDRSARSSSIGGRAGGRAASPERGLRGVGTGPGRRTSMRPATSEGYVMAGEERRGSIWRARAAERQEPATGDIDSLTHVPQPSLQDPSSPRFTVDEPSQGISESGPVAGSSATPIPMASTSGGTGYIFGEPVTSGSPSSVIRQSPTSSANRSIDSSEAAEAERQRIAFMTSTYGLSTRGSLSGGAAGIGAPGSRRGSTLRDQLISASASTPEGKKFLLGNEGYRRGSLGIPGFDTSGLTGLSTSASTTASGAGMSVALGAQIGQGSGATSAASSHDGRRGSVPIAIPERDPRRTPSTASEDILESEDEDEEDDFSGSMTESYRAQLAATGRDQHYPMQPARALLNRPLPPLLPLSDPGPRLLPSTLALHRASHLLSSKNLASEPLPHPLPPSLHPPAPVSVSDLDLDFILSGAYDPPLIDESKRNLSMGNTALARYAMQNRPGVQLGPGGTDEDSFAKFVGAFDEEYDSRRGDWTFRARPEGRTADHTEWESPGAGRYTINNACEVVSHRTGKGWRVKKVGPRELELDRIPEEPAPSSSESSVSSDRAAAYRRDHLVLASKRLHTDLGGLKIISRSGSIATTLGAGHARQAGQETRAAQSGHEPGSSGPRASQVSQTDVNPPTTAELQRTTRSQDEGSRSGAAQAIKGIQAKIKEVSGVKDRVKKKDRGSFGDKLKRTWLATVKPGGSSSSSDKASRREERERERGQSRSWSGESTQSNWSTSSSGASNRNRSATAEAPNIVPPLEQGHGASGLSSLPEDEERSSLSAIIPGKAWETVPDEAMAMVIPLRDAITPTTTPLRPTPSAKEASDQASFFKDTFSRVLLVYFVPFMSGIESIPNSPVPRLQPERRLSTTQRLLRRQSKDKVQSGPSQLSESSPTEKSYPKNTGALSPSALHPLPFRSFRIVAKVVRPRDLKSQSGQGESHEAQDEEDELPSSGCGDAVKQAERAEARDELTEISPFLTSPPPRLRGSDATIIADKKRAGSEFPIIVAVCHSRSQGVEFVLEGLDRLDLCSGQSAWGPTGYEEWRGSGLSADGWEVLDTLWAACVGIMGLQGSQ